MKAKLHQVAIKTSRPISRFEKWLDANCEAGWDIQLTEISDDLLQKTYSVTFESTRDAAAFRTALHQLMQARMTDVPGVIASGQHASGVAHLANTQPRR